MRPEVLLLDCGGTLTWPPFGRMNAVLSELTGHSLAEDVYYRSFYRSLHGIDQARTEYGYPAREDVVDHHHWAYDLGLSREAGPGLWNLDCTREMLRRETRMGNWDYTLPFVEPALSQLKDAGFRLAVVSNADGFVEEMLGRLGYARFFEVIIDSEVVGVAKPDPRIFHIAMQRLGLDDYLAQAQRAARGEADPPPVHYVGDTRAMDVEGSRAAGITVTLLDPLGLYADSGIDTARDIADFAEKISAL